MHRVWRWGAPVLVLAVAATVVRAAAGKQRVWQADLQIRTVEITRSRTGVSVRIVVYTEHDDEAKDARLVILLPVGVGLERLAPGCVASAGPSMVPSIRATVACELGVIADQGYREVHLSTTPPTDAMPRRLGVFTYSATPDPVPANNYAERRIP